MEKVLGGSRGRAARGKLQKPLEAKFCVVRVSIAPDLPYTALPANSASLSASFKQRVFGETRLCIFGGACMSPELDWLVVGARCVQ